eukprot:PITA_20948
MAIFLWLIITLESQICKAQRLCGIGVNWQYLYVCHYNNYNYTEGSTFEGNLNTVMNSLIKDTSQTGFNTSVYGKSPDQVYGLLQCRGDATAEQCYNCSQEANTTLRQNCGNAQGGLIWFTYCFLRYENYNFIGQLDTNDACYTSIGSVTSANVFNQALDGLFTKLLSEATSGSKLYASGTTRDSLFREIYAMVQCTRDISIDNCSSCLSGQKAYIFATYSGTEGAQSLTGSCRVRYEIYSFFNSSSSHGQVEEDTAINEDRQIAFTMEELIAAKVNFHDNNKLGEGGFGAVYKGTAEDGKEIAVKKLSLKSRQGKEEFLNEVKLVGKIQHRNLVNLLGCCAEGSERLLVYEYLPNNSLDKILFETDTNKRSQLDWQKRYNIIVGVARGLLYLHEDSQLRIIHWDIKASNILLDENLNPKIADFGLARLFPEDLTHVSTRVAGTYGYMAPEYAMHGQLSVKADVYSFGVLLLELVTGRKNANFNLSPEMQLLLAWAWRLHKGGNIVDMIDPTIIGTCDVDEALRCIHIGLLCTQADSSLRPSMTRINLMLSSTLPDPIQPASFHAPLSNADASITHSVPR